MKSSFLYPGEYFLYPSRRIFFEPIPKNTFCTHTGEYFLYPSWRIFFVHILENIFCTHPGEYLLCPSWRIFVVPIPENIFCTHPGEYFLCSFRRIFFFLMHKLLKLCQQVRSQRGGVQGVRCTQLSPKMGIQRRICTSSPF